eukprot:scaffold5491_cov117-Isochrysis_galbana.AAC.5
MSVQKGGRWGGLGGRALCVRGCGRAVWTRVAGGGRDADGSQDHPPHPACGGLAHLRGDGEEVLVAGEGKDEDRDRSADSCPRCSGRVAQPAGEVGRKSRVGRGRSLGRRWQQGPWRNQRGRVRRPRHRHWRPGRGDSGEGPQRAMGGRLGADVPCSVSGGAGARLARHADDQDGDDGHACQRQ